MTLCDKHNLYDGIIYVQTRALRDFLTPLRDLVGKLERVMASTDLLSDEDVLLGNKILLYLWLYRLPNTYHFIGFKDTSHLL